MTPITLNTTSFLAAIHPYDTLTKETLETLSSRIKTLSFEKGQTIYQQGQHLDGLYIIVDGTVEITIETGEHISTPQGKKQLW